MRLASYSEPHRRGSLTGCSPSCPASCLLSCRRESCQNCPPGCSTGCSPLSYPRCSAGCDPCCPGSCGSSRSTGCGGGSPPRSSDRCSPGCSENCLPSCSSHCSTNCRACNVRSQSFEHASQRPNSHDHVRLAPPDAGFASRRDALCPRYRFDLWLLAFSFPLPQRVRQLLCVFLLHPRLLTRREETLLAQRLQAFVQPPHALPRPIARTQLQEHGQRLR